MMVSDGEKHKFHLHLPHIHLLRHQGSKDGRDLPKKGWLAIVVGQGEEEPQRFVVPVDYFNHPLFEKLLKEAENEYGFEQKSTINLPCHVEDFRCVRKLIDGERSNHHALGWFRV